MSPIQMVDTKTQYLKIKKEVDEAVLSVMESSRFIGGPVVTDFATQLATYNGSKQVITCANGTDALQIAIMALGLQPGDEIIMPSFTYIATVEVAALLRIKPVFVDVNPDDFCINAELIEAAITPNTKAIVPVHLYGAAADMEKIMAVAKKHKLFVIEDNAQAIGNDYTFSDGTVKKTGSMGHIGCTSFYPSKNLGAFGDGGAIFTDDEALANTMRMIASHGQSRQYYHDITGCNSRLDAMQAAVLSIKLRHLDEYAAARRAAADRYDELLAGIPGLRTPVRPKNNNHVFHQYTLILEEGDRDGLQKQLAEKAVPAMIYYPVPAHKQKMFDFFNLPEVNLPVTDWLTSRVISIPMHTELADDQQTFIATTIKEYLTR